MNARTSLEDIEKNHIERIIQLKYTIQQLEIMQKEKLQECQALHCSAFSINSDTFDFTLNYLKASLKKGSLSFEIKELENMIQSHTKMLQQENEYYHRVQEQKKLNLPSAVASDEISVQ